MYDQGEMMGHSIYICRNGSPKMKRDRRNYACNLDEVQFEMITLSLDSLWALTFHHKLNVLQTNVKCFTQFTFSLLEYFHDS